MNSEFFGRGRLTRFDITFSFISIVLVSAGFYWFLHLLRVGEVWLSLRSRSSSSELEEWLSQFSEFALSDCSSSSIRDSGASTKMVNRLKQNYLVQLIAPYLLVGCALWIFSVPSNR